MRAACPILCLLSVVFGVSGSEAAGGGPVVLARVPLSALPANLSVGPAGPLNRIAFDLTGYDPAASGSRVTCTYPNNLHYLCDAAASDPVKGIASRRVTVTIPDLGLGKRVIVRFATAQGATDVTLDLANQSQVIHEIEALPLRQGGQTTVDGSGRMAPILQLVSEQAPTMPAAALSPLAADPACDQFHAIWVGASATDPVFTSVFGALPGSVVLAKPVVPGSRVQPGNVPEWLLSYPLSATRVQFIAHYEMSYRVGACPHKTVKG